MLDKDGYYQPFVDDDGNEDDMYLLPTLAPTTKASKNETNVSVVGKKKGLQQNVLMAEFARMRNRKQKQVSPVQQPQQVSPATAEQKKQQLQPRIQPAKASEQEKSVQEPKMQPATAATRKNIQPQPRMQPAEVKQSRMQPTTVAEQKNRQLQSKMQQIEGIEQEKNAKQPRMQPTNVAEQKMQPATEQKDERMKRRKLQRDQCCAPGSLSIYKNMRQKQLGRSSGHLPTVELPPSSLIQDKASECMLNVTQQDQSMQGSPIGTLLSDALVHGENRMGIEEENQDSTQKVAEKKKHRGPTLMVKVHQRTYRKEIALNGEGQPIGPPSAATELAGFLGTIAKDPTLTPVNILDWRCMPTKEDIWNYVQEKYKIPEEGKTYVLQTVNDNWRTYKSRRKSDHYTAYETDEERWKHRPTTIPENQFRELLDYWDSPVGKELARNNTINRKKHEDVHTLGHHSIARLRHELEQKNKKTPSDSEIYKVSRKRDVKRAYKTNGCKAKENIDEMNNVQQQIERGEKGKDVDPFSEVIAKKHKRRAFLQGRGLKLSSLKGKEKNGSYLLDNDFFQNMKEAWTKELIPALTSKILSQIQAVYPHLDFNIPDSSNQVSNEMNLPNDGIETHLSQQDSDEDEIMHHVEDDHVEG